MCAQSLQSCLTLCDLMDCSPPGSSVHWISQARILEWIAISSSRGSSRPGVEPVSHVASAPQADSLPLSHWGSPSSGNKKFSTTQEKAMSLCKGFYIHVFGN